MDKQKQIEETAQSFCEFTHNQIMYGSCEECQKHIKTECWYLKKAKEVCERIFPENVVVLTKEEALQVYKQMKMQGKLIQEVKSEMKETQQKFSKEFEEYRLQVRKETAEKYSEMLKELVAERNCNEDYDWEDVQIDGQIFIECIDEVGKKIMESRDEFHSRDN